MQQLAKQFSINLNKALDDIGLPNNPRDRLSAFSKMVDIPKPQANAFLEGHLIPDDDILNHIAKELEVEPNWLRGQKNHLSHR